MEVLTVSRLADQTLGEVELGKIFPEGMAGNVILNIPAAEVGHRRGNNDWGATELLKGRDVLCGMFQTLRVGYLNVNTSNGYLLHDYMSYSSASSTNAPSSLLCPYL
jgi:hypothetical protein